MKNTQNKNFTEVNQVAQTAINNDLQNTLYYVLDPMCSWCYAFSPTFKSLLKNLPSTIKVVLIHGGLAPHSSEPMQEHMKSSLQNIWRQIESQVGISFNYDFWTKCEPRRSTYLACQACIAARIQGKEYEMIEAIQDLYYKQAENPSNKDTLELAAKNIDLDIEKFKIDLESQKTINIFHEDLTKRRDLKINSFPSLILQSQGEYNAIQIEFNNYKSILNQINNVISYQTTN